MVKQTLVAVCLIAMLCGIVYAGEPNDVIVIPTTPGITLWGQVENTEQRLIGLRGGYETNFQVEIGGTALWRHEKGQVWDSTPDLGGVYLAYWIDELGLVGDSDGYSGIEDLLHLLVAKPYALLEGLYDNTRDDIAIGIGGGSAFYAKQDKKQSLALTVEYVSIENYEQKLVLGVRLKF